MTARTLDHVALWVAALEVRVVADHAIGADARRFKLTLFAEEGPRDPGALKGVTLRANDGDEGTYELGEGLTVNLVRAQTDVDYDLDNVALWSADPEATADEYLSLGFNEAEARDGVPRVELGGAFVTPRTPTPSSSGAPSA